MVEQPHGKISFVAARKFCSQAGTPSTASPNSRWPKRCRRGVNVSRNTIGLACLGTGYITSIYARCASAVEGVQVRAVWSRSEQAGSLFAEKHGVPRVYTDYQRLLEDPEVNAVIVGLPTPMHHAAALQAAKAGKHTLCEQPIAMTAEEGGVPRWSSGDWLLDPRQSGGVPVDLHIHDIAMCFLRGRSSGRDTRLSVSGGSSSTTTFGTQL